MAEITFPSLDLLLPHRQPMILLTRMIEAEELRAACEVDIRPSLPFALADEMPAFVGIEYMAQSVAAFNGFKRYRTGQPIEVGFLLGTPKLTSFCKAFAFGQTLRIEVAHVWGEAQLARFECCIKDAKTGELLQQADLTVFKPENFDSFLNNLNK
jgi:predicted hotdog family 3-hydroxylacyl-ACP dehydratase